MQEGYGSSMLGDAQNQTGRSREPPALIGPALSRVNEPDDLQIFLPTTTILQLSVMDAELGQIHASLKCRKY